MNREENWSNIDKNTSRRVITVVKIYFAREWERLGKWNEKARERESSQESWGEREREREREKKRREEKKENLLSSGKECNVTQL